MISLSARHLRAAFAACLVFATAPPLAAQGTAPVPLDDPAYVYLDRLEELGLVDSGVMGQRPYSYREMERLERAARAAASARAGDANESALVRELLERLEARVVPPVSPRALLIDDGLLAVTSTNAVRRLPPPAGSASSPQASIDPLALRRLGQQPVRGPSLALEFLQRAEPASWLAINARERAETRHPLDPSLGSHDAELLEGGVRVRWRNAALMVGREQLGWGSGARGGLFIASDAPALDQLTISSEHPFLLPSLLRRVGAFSGTITLAEMGPSTARSHSKMLAYKLSARPSSTLEVGATFQNHFGGEGGRTSPFWYRVIDFLPMIDIFRRHNYVDTTHVFDVDSDKAIGTDVRWRIDRWGGTTVAAEILLDDFDVHRLNSILNYAASHAITITVPKLASPAWSLRLDATHMGPLTYTHSNLTQGMTTKGRLLGNELGPDVKAFGAALRWMPSAATDLALAGTAAIYSNTAYASGYDINGRWVVQKLSSAPDELREQIVGSVALAPTPVTVATVRIGVGRTRNVMFVGGRRHSYVADLGLRWRP